jgi:hypothetical protein
VVEVLVAIALALRLLLELLTQAAVVVAVGPQLARLEVQAS